MQEFPYVLSEYEELNSLLYKPINSTRRIKYTCFGASCNYIILGSTSGSVYLFSRKPCSFQQLIPLSEGAVSRVSISPDENKLALATSRGSVCLLALKPTSKLLAVSTEHISNQVRCLCWNDNSSEVYIGDGAGKVSVMALSIFTVNGMFQTPTCTLMSLDSAVVQLSFSFPLLLVSTLTRCYVCDTMQEQYKHIGNKGRNGEFGACFYKSGVDAQKGASVSPREEKLVGRKHSFNFIPDGNAAEVEEGNFPKIFCARPGSRLWEVSANGVVLKTHQFKDALAIPPVRICRRGGRESIHCENEAQEIWTAQSINFSHLSVVAEKYLFSYTSSGGLYVIDPASASVILWCNQLAEITMAEAVGSRIYIMNSQGEFRCLTFSSLDSLILRLYSRKQYQDCLDACVAHRTQLEGLIQDQDQDQDRVWEESCDMESKLHVRMDEELSTILRPVTLALQSNLDARPKRLDSGIVMVHSGNLDLKDQDCFTYRKSLPEAQSRSPTKETTTPSVLRGKGEAVESKDIQRDQTIDQLMDANCNAEQPPLKLQFSPSASVFQGKDDERNLGEKPWDRVQIDLEAIYALSGKMSPSMSEEELETVTLDIDRRVNSIKDSYGTWGEFNELAFQGTRGAEMYYFDALLENVSCQVVSDCSSRQLVKILTRAFVSVNVQRSTRCICGCSYPENRLTEPKFLGIGRSLVRRFANENEHSMCLSLCNKVPYMWREYLQSCVKQGGVVPDDFIHQCLQTRDNTVLSFLLPLLDCKQCSLLATCLLKMGEGRCLFCERSVEKLREPLIDWNGIMREITKHQGPDIAVTVLTKLEKAIPNVPIDKSIFQSLVFTKILHQHGMKCAVDFNNSTLGSSECSTMCSTEMRDQLMNILERDLGRPINKNVFGSGAHHWGMRYYRNKSSICPCCTLSLQTPVLLGNNGIAIFCCGHAYHVNCMIERKLSTCNLH